jgi:hypothetical protein
MVPRMLSTAGSDAPPSTSHGRPPWYRRVTTLLLAGWCAGWVLYLWSAQAGRYGCPAGQPSCDRFPAPAHSWLWGLAGGVVLAALCVVQARRPAVNATASAEGRPRRRWLILGGVAGAVLGAHLVLLGPMTEGAFCAKPIHVNRVMAYPLNCDSGEFMSLAHYPSRILEYHNLRQSRPGYVALSVVAERTIGPVARALRLDRLYGMTDRAQFPLVVINLAATAAAIALLAWQLAGLGTPRPANAALCGFLAVNEVTTAFTWTPHQQTFALLVPVATIVVGRWLLLARAVRWGPAALAGLAAGGASLVYGSFLITAAVAGIILLFQRRLLALAAFMAAFATPQLAWMALCEIVSGDYHNEELEVYDQFVWLPRAAGRGADALWMATHDATLTTARELFSICTVPLLLIAGLAAVAVLTRVRLSVLSESQRATVIAAGLVAVAGVAFGWGIGLMADRVMFHAFPALLVLAGWVAARIAAASPRAGRLVTAGVVVFAAVALTADIMIPGPYS